MLAVVAVFAGDRGARARRTSAPAVSGAEGARRLALVLRAAQAEAQSRSASVRVEVGGGGDYVVTAGRERLMSGRLGGAVASTYPGGAVEFSGRGLGRSAGLVRVRAPATSAWTGATASRTVVVQLSGCVRCA